MKHRPEIYESVIERIITDSKNLYNLDLSRSSLTSKNPIARVTLSNNKYVKIDISTDGRDGYSYYTNSDQDPDYTFNNIIASIKRNSIRGEFLNYWTNDGSIRSNRPTTEGYRYIMDRINSMMNSVDDEVNRAKYIVNIFNTKEKEIFKSNNLSISTINTGVSVKETISRNFEWSMSGKPNRRRILISKDESGYSMDIDEGIFQSYNGQTPKLISWERIYELPPNEKDMDKFLNLFLRVYEYYFG